MMLVEWGKNGSSKFNKYLSCVLLTHSETEINIRFWIKYLLIMWTYRLICGIEYWLGKFDYCSINYSSISCHTFTNIIYKWVLFCRRNFCSNFLNFLAIFEKQENGWVGRKEINHWKSVCAKFRCNVNQSQAKCTSHSFPIWQISRTQECEKLNDEGKIS